MADTDDLQDAPSRDRHVAAGSSGNGQPVETCAGCGLPLTRRGPKGECLRCLMDFAFAPEEGEAPTASFPNGKLPGKNAWRYGHFDIAVGADGHPVELGAGAMATTYSALDTVLHSAVALKVINQKVAEHPGARARFLREARAAARLHHPNVASVSHYGEQDGECYYAMELVEGETLEARVRREGPLPPALVLEIGVQVARALAAAEACGVMHRDLKPSNIMLTTPQGEKTDGNASTVVKVIDWGLAKAVSAESTLGIDHTHGGFVGTPAFASPEQFLRAEDRRVDHRSDIYSLGVTLWYLLCGKTPFSGSTLEEIHARQVTHPIPFAQLATARVPAQIIALLKSMMAVDPAARPQSARELLDLMRGCQERFPVGGTPPKTRRAHRRRWVLAALVFVVGTLAALAVEWYYLRLPASSLSSGNSVAVLPLENLSPQPDAAFFAAGMQDAITADLARIAQLKVIDSEGVKSYPTNKPRDLTAIGRALGVDHLLEGSVRRDGDRVRIELRLTDVRHPTRTWTAKYERPLAEEFVLLSEITHAVAGRLGTRPSPSESAVIDQRPTHDPVAYDLYLQSLQRPPTFDKEEDLRESARKVIGLLNAAVARDPGFTLAYCWLAIEHDTIVANPDGATPEELAVDHRAMAESALARARNLQPDNGRVHLAQATHLYLITHDYEEARLEVDLARRTLPNHANLEDLAGRIAMGEGHCEDAARFFEKAVALRPRDVRELTRLGQTYEYMRRYDDADRQAAIVESLLPPGTLPSLHMGRAFFKVEGQADLRPLRAALAEVTDETDPDHEMRNGYGMILALLSHDESGIRFMVAASKEKVCEIGSFKYPMSWFEAIAARIRHDEAGAQASFTKARSEVENMVAANPLDERNLLLLAMIDAGLGHKDEAVREAQRACAMKPLETDTLMGPSNRCGLAVVYAWTNQSDLAFTELDKLVAGPSGENYPYQPTYGDFKLNPLWDPLRDDPRFVAITQRLAPSILHP